MSCDAARLRAGVPVIELLVGWPGSRPRTARRAGWCVAAARALNDERIDDETATVDLSAVRDGHIKLSAGRKRHVLVRPA